MSFKKEFFQNTKYNEKVYRLILKNENGMEVEILNYGATIRKLLVPDKNGNTVDIVIGHKDLEEYENSSYQGGTIGRYANRIAKGKFSLKGKDYTLKTNDGENHLHGGNNGYNLKIWDIESFDNSPTPSVTLKHFDPDMYEGYCGNVTVFVTFTLTNDNSLKINYKATTDKETVINLTNHSYFNLDGYNSGIAMGQFVKINADYYTPINDVLIPTGEIKSVENTPFDFKNFKQISQNINDNDKDLEFAGGYDHNFVLNTKNINEEAIVCYSKNSGIKMSVFTDMPGVQFYTANFLDGTSIGKDGKPLNYRTGYCFETQFFPDSPNKKNFPSCVLNPNEEYNHTTIFKFDTI